MLLLSVIAKFVILWTVLNALFNAVFSTIVAVRGSLRRGHKITAKQIAQMFVLALIVHGVLPIKQNVQTIAAIYRNLKAKLAAWSFKRQYPNVTRGDFSYLAQGAL